MAYVVLFSDGSERFELGAATIEAAHAIVNFLTNANALDVSVVSRLDCIEPDDSGQSGPDRPTAGLVASQYANDAHEPR